MLKKTFLIFAILTFITSISLQNHVFLEMEQEREMMPESLRECPFNYTVRTGDTLMVIAHKFNSTIEELTRINNLEDPNVIKIGDKLTIPCTLGREDSSRRNMTIGAVGAEREEEPEHRNITETTREEEETKCPFTYSVKENDTIESIAQEFNLKPEDLISHNNLTLPATISQGMSLNIPCPSEERTLPMSETSRNETSS
jgi:LysM repeat protein